MFDIYWIGMQFIQKGAEERFRGYPLEGERSDRGVVGYKGLERMTDG